MPVATPSTLGARVRVLRETRGWTLRELERRAGVSNARISQLETGRNPDVGVVLAMKIATAFGVSVNYLLGDFRGGYSDGLAKAEEIALSFVARDLEAGSPVDAAAREVFYRAAEMIAAAIRSARDLPSA